jgi:hypothetical protein
VKRIEIEPVFRATIEPDSQVVFCTSSCSALCFIWLSLLSAGRSFDGRPGGGDFWQDGTFSLVATDERGFPFAIHRDFLAAYYSAFDWRWDKEIKNVIRSDGYRRIELLGSHSGGS